VSQWIDDGQEAFQRQRDEAVRRRHEHAPQRHLGEPQTTQRLVGPVAASQWPLVILQQRGQEEERGDRRVDEALVDEVQVGDALSHRPIRQDDCHHEHVGAQPEQS